MLAAMVPGQKPNPRLARDIVSVVIVSYNTVEMLGEMLATLRGAIDEIDSRVTIVDNNSCDGSAEFVRSRYPTAQLIANSDNVGFGRANNQALANISGRYVLLLNTDAFVEQDSLIKTTAYMDNHPKCGILGARLVGRDGVLQPSCRYFPTPWNNFLARAGLSKYFPKAPLVDDMDWDHDATRSCDWVPGCFYLIRREVINQVGLFDPRYFLYYEEVDHCLAAKKAGWEVHYFSGTTVVHIGGESAKSEGELTDSGRQISTLQIESELLYFRKNHGILGVVNAVVLSVAADVILSVKWLLKGRHPSGLAAYAKHAIQVLSVFLRTSWGSRPTR